MTKYWQQLLIESTKNGISYIYRYDKKWPTKKWYLIAIFRKMCGWFLQFFRFDFRCKLSVQTASIFLHLAFEWTWCAKEWIELLIKIRRVFGNFSETIVRRDDRLYAFWAGFFWKCAPGISLAARRWSYRFFLHFKNIFIKDVNSFYKSKLTSIRLFKFNGQFFLTVDDRVTLSILAILAAIFVLLMSGISSSYKYFRIKWFFINLFKENDSIS